MKEKLSGCRQWETVVLRIVQLAAEGSWGWSWSWAGEMAPAEDPWFRASCGVTQQRSPTRSNDLRLLLNMTSTAFMSGDS